MKPISEAIKGDVVKKMFPYQMKVYYVRTWVDTSKPPTEWEEITEEFLLGDVPCSVQSATSSNGAVLENEYIILSPCLDLTPITEGVELPEDATTFYRLEVSMNGRTNTAKQTEILSIDNLEVYKIGTYSIGCKIRVKKTASTWAW